MISEKKIHCIKVKSYRYVEISGDKFFFGSLRNNLNEFFGKSENNGKEDFCEIFKGVPFEFCGGRLSAAVIPEGYDVFADGCFLGDDFNDAAEKLEMCFAPVVKLCKKGCVCSDRAGVICLSRGTRARILVCCKDYYSRYSSMLFLMEQCEQMPPVNDV